jgi:hypothetical protein
MCTTPLLLGLELDTLAIGRERELMLDLTMMVQLLGGIHHNHVNMEDGLVPDEEEEEDEHLTKVEIHPFDLHKMRTLMTSFEDWLMF